jgi:hypothetical protein
VDDPARVSDLQTRKHLQSDVDRFGHGQRLATFEPVLE